MKSHRSSVLLLVLYLHLEVHGEPEAAPGARTSGAGKVSLNVYLMIGQMDVGLKKKQFIYCVLIFVSGGGGDYAHGIWDPGRVLMWGLSSCTNWFQHQKVVKTLNPTLVSHRTIKIKIGFWNTRHHHMQIQVFLQTSFLLKIIFTTNKFWF